MLFGTPFRPIRYRQEEVVAMALFLSGQGMMFTNDPAAATRMKLGVLDNIARVMIRDLGGFSLHLQQQKLPFGWIVSVWPLKRRWRAWNPCPQFLALFQQLRNRIGERKKRGLVDEAAWMGLSRGLSIIAGKKGQYLDVIGAPLTKATDLCQKARELNVEILADDTVADMWPAGFCEREAGLYVAESSPS